jgi:hypothetical protein
MGRMCLPEKDLIAAFLGTTGFREKCRVLDHVAVCPDCAREFRALMALWRKRGEIPEDLRVDLDMKMPARREIAGMKLGRRVRGFLFAPPGRRALSLAAGAVVLFACVVTYSLWNDRKGSDVDRIVRPGGVVLLAPKDGETVRPSFFFRWSAVEDASGYTLEVLDSSLLPVMTFPHLKETEYEPSAEDLAKLGRGGAYFWKVTADLDDLLRIESRIGRFALSD